jgi:diamine N-acetyltransferase
VIIGGILMQLVLKKIDKENWEECADLKVSQEQEAYVDSNSYSILLSKFEEECYPFCIYDEEVMVGFIMYGLDPETKRLEMSRLMIDKKFQGKGYGTKAILRTLDIIREKYGEIKFYTSIEQQNTVAQKLYESLGFKKTGEIMWGEDVMVIQL